MNIFENIGNHDYDAAIVENLLPLVDDVYGDHTSLVVNEYEFMDSINSREEYNDYLEGGDNYIPTYIASLLAKYGEEKFGGEWDYKWTEGSFIAINKEFEEN